MEFYYFSVFWNPTVQLKSMETPLASIPCMFGPNIKSILIPFEIFDGNHRLIVTSLKTSLRNYWQMLPFQELGFINPRTSPSYCGGFPQYIISLRSILVFSTLQKAFSVFENGLE